ncbi:hypothetical protein RA2_00707 [Roseovarius sp. A-2]|uniref:hypothetical protein n=1 Tax=Roseovarius sp. A-2 TaxID=1570360 RepID=UPI0009B515D1|nr:hypothetical protein [Roseovarius sp. A-2]GAW33664.1 hypothetical protein RA2_00707 [Roseovarius sp. A-2]
MSDPVKNVDIEDVLSSIRRLVSNGPDATGPKDEAISDKLVLTPSLRVDEKNAPDASAADEIARLDEEARQPEPDYPASQYVAGPEASPDAGKCPDDVEESSDSGDDTQEPDAVSQMDLVEQQNTGHDEAGEQYPGTDTSEPDDEEIDRFLGEVTSALGAQAAEFEEEVAQREDQWEPDGASDDAYAGGPVASVEWQDASDDEAEDDFAPSSDPDMEPADEAASYAYARSWEATDDAGQRDAPGNAFDFDDAVIDEDTLRDMVAEIVRQELQGTLGERITRNVRKLVRREIHRALTSQDFE